MRAYNLNPKSAASAGAANYVSETGKYIGQFTRAEAITSKKGTEGIELSFVTQEGLKCDYLQLWTYNAAGDELPGLRALNAIMACLRLRNIDPAKITVDRRDGARETVDGFPTLMGKPIGLLLQREEYEKMDGSIGYKFNVFAPFDAQSEMTAGEILGKKSSGEQLVRMVASLKDKPLKPRANGYETRTVSSGSSGGGVDDMDSDVPFNNPYRGAMAYAV